jgi:hypothetical protein
MTLPNAAPEAENSGTDGMLRVYKFLLAKYALEDIERRRVKISEFPTLNDPFDLLPYRMQDEVKHRRLFYLKEGLGDNAGMLCFSQTWQNPLLWAHYADCHKGICLGFDVAKAYGRKINYCLERLTSDDVSEKEIAEKAPYTKFKDWEYEKEFRLYASIHERDGGHAFSQFTKRIALRDVIVGMGCCTSREEIDIALLKSGVAAHPPVNVFKVRPSHTEFQMIRDEACSF